MGEWRKAAEISASGFKRGIEIHRSLLLFQLLFCIWGNSIRWRAILRAPGEREVRLGKGEVWLLPSRHSGLQTDFRNALRADWQGLSWSEEVPRRRRRMELRLE